MISKPLFALSAVALIAACTVGPDYTPPVAEVSARFVEGGAQAAVDTTAQRWWLDYNDARLTALIDAGLARNLDVASAVSLLRQAEASARAAGAAALVDGSLTMSATRAGGEGTATTNTRRATTSPSLVIDLFGGQRRAREEAVAQMEAARMDIGTARLSVLSSIASNYIELRYYQEALAVTRQTVSSRSETLSLVQRVAQAGSATVLDEAQAQASLDSARATLPSLESGFYAAVYALATLTDQPAERLIATLQNGAPQPRPSGGADVGVPADLLRQRPDVRAAERDYAAAVAALGVSTADLYPSLSLGGTISLTGSGSGSTSSWSFGPDLVIPVLSRPRLLANRDAAEARAEQARLAWRASVLDAVEDVQAAQTAYLRNRRTVAAYRKSAASYARVADLSDTTYRAGATTLLDLLDTQRSLASARLTLAGALRDQATSWARLQVAAGRGWATEATNSGM